jgi:predicted membrane-bound dolichyl-phosphate-mannose-protein mannosyltransferase
LSNSVTKFAALAAFSALVLFLTACAEVVVETVLVALAMSVLIDAVILFPFLSYTAFAKLLVCRVD